MIVSEVPGRRATRSTRCCERDETTFVLVDTAGLRRKRRQRQGIEYYSELRALEAAERADVALVLVDASEGIVEQDLAVADVARKAGARRSSSSRSGTSTEHRPRRRTRGLLSGGCASARPLIAVSAKTGRGLERLLDHVETLFAKHIGADPDAGGSTGRSAS